MKNRKNIILTVSITVAMLLGFMSGQYFFDQDETASAPIRAMVPETPRKLAIPPLQKGGAGVFDMASLQGKWSLMFFGYTNCPDICPSTLNTIALAKKEVEKAGRTFPQVVFVSVDPERDDVKVLGDYVHYFDKDFVGVTGEEKLLRAITVQVSSTFMTQPSENKNKYEVSHSVNLVLISPSVELVAILRPPHSIESIVDALQHFQQ